MVTDPSAGAWRCTKPMFVPPEASAGDQVEPVGGQPG